MLHSGFKDGALIVLRAVDRLEFAEPEQTTQFFRINFIVFFGTLIDQGVFPGITNDDLSDIIAGHLRHPVAHRTRFEDQIFTFGLNGF